MYKVDYTRLEKIWFCSYRFRQITSTYMNLITVAASLILLHTPRWEETEWPVHSMETIMYIAVFSVSSSLFGYSKVRDYHADWNYWH